MEWLSEALPSRFSFYHLGEVELRPDAAPAELEGSLQGMQAVGFRFQGDIRGFLMIVFEAGLDTSTYTEMGNILCSQIATKLSQNHGWDIMISPPQVLSTHRVKAIVESSPDLLGYTYVHTDAVRGYTTPVQALILPTLEEGANA